MKPLLLVLPLFASACAMSPTTPDPDLDLAAHAPVVAWHSCRARLAWPEGEAPDWSLDVFLAYAVFGPALDAHAEDIELWRFHRRAGRDGAGHRFSFIYRSDGVSSERLQRTLRDNVYLKWARHDGLVEALTCSDEGGWSGEDLAATSDGQWPPELQRAWPWFIQGVSRTWLELVRAEMSQVRPDADFDTVREASREAQLRVSAVWGEQGRHAFLHHLNAVFGYQPLLMRY